jgi:hypothetical protein
VVEPVRSGVCGGDQEAPGSKPFIFTMALASGLSDVIAFGTD